MARIQVHSDCLCISPDLLCGARAGGERRALGDAGAGQNLDPYGNDIFCSRSGSKISSLRASPTASGEVVEPGLAVSWKRLDARMWEMELRQGITFHDGAPFTSADVVFSIERAKAETSSQRAIVSNIAAG